MPVILRCDAIDCTQEMASTGVAHGRPAVLEGWWLQVVNVEGNPRYTVACCAAHLVPASDAVRSR